MSDRPNVLLITADQFRGDCLGVAGNPYIQTPHLDQIACSGLRCSGAFSESPICIPARRSLMTGQNCWTHEVHRNENVGFDHNPTFLAQAFGDAGYQTQAVGKLHVSPQRRRIGFDHVLLNEEGRREDDLEYDDYEMYLQERGLRQQLWAHGMPANSLHSRPASLPEEHISDQWTAREGTRFLERRDPTSPFFLYCSFRNPHPPLTPPQVYWDLYKDRPVREPVVGNWVGENEPASHQYVRCVSNCDMQTTDEQLQAIRAYYGLISNIDHQIGVLIGNLRERKLLKNTIILFTSDHGEMLFDHRMAYKGLFYNASCNVPMLLSVPESMNDRYRPGEVRNHPVMLQDVMPTLLDLAGIKAPKGMDGKSMAGIWENDKARWRKWAVGDHGQRHYGITDNKWKYMYFVEGGVQHLFNMVDDPEELNDLSMDAAHANEVAKWRKRLVTELKKVDDPNVDGDDLYSRAPTRIDDQDMRRESWFNTRGYHW